MKKDNMLAMEKDHGMFKIATANKDVMRRSIRSTHLLPMTQFDLTKVTIMNVIDD